MSGHAEIFRGLHKRGEPLRLLNAWDGASARVFEAAGAPAVATTSAGASFSLGVSDGERMTRDQMVANVRLIASAVTVPVTADIETGYGRSLADVKETVRMVIAAGAVGINIEDRARDDRGASSLLSVAESAERVAAAREAADEAGVDLFINARTDTFLLGGESTDELVHAALSRFAAFADAGATGAFAPGPTDGPTIAALARGTTLPLNALATPGAPTVDDLAAMGVARISTGAAPARASITKARDVATEFLTDGTIEAVADAMSYAEINELLAP